MTNEKDPRNSAADSARPLFFQQRFWPVWWTLSLGTFADNTLRQALLVGIPYGIVKVSFFDNPDDAMPVIGALFPAAIMLFTPLSGQLADKYETSMMFRRTKFAEIILMVVAAGAFITGNGILAVAMLFFMGAQSAFYSPVRVSSMPKYLAPDELLRGAGLCNAGLFGFILLGYAVGGFLIVSEGGGVKVGITLIAAAFIGWLASLRTLPAAANAPSLKLSFNWFTQCYRMFRFVFDAPGVAAPLLGVSAFYFLTTAVTVIVPLFARDALNADAQTATVLNVLFAIGAGMGAIYAASLSKKTDGLKHSTIAVILAGTISIAITLVAPILSADTTNPFTVNKLFTTTLGWFITGSFVSTSALMGVYIAPLQAAVQRRAPPETRARIMAAMVFASALFAIPGSLAILFITRTGARPELTFIAVGIGMICIGVTMIYRAKRKTAMPDRI